MKYNELKAIVNELKGFVSKTPSTFYLTSARTFILQFGKKKILISMQEPYLRLYESRVDHLFKPDPFANKIEKLVLGKRLQDIRLDPNDRIVTFAFEGCELIAFLIPRNPNLILNNLSLNPVKPLISRAQPIQEESNATSLELEKSFLEQIAKKEAEEKEAALKKAREKIEKEIKKAEKWPEKMERARLIQASLYSYDKKSHSLQLIGEEERIAIPRQMTAEAYLEKHLKEARRLKGQLEILKEKWENPLSEKKKIEERKPYIEFISKSGFKIWVGRSAKGNDIITFKLARGSDLWMHVLHEKGAHVIVRAVKGKEIDLETIKEAEQLALQYSKAKNKILEVAKSYVKNLKRGKKPGEVIYSSF